MKLLEVIKKAKKKGYNYIQDNACPITAIYNYDFGSGENKNKYTLTNCTDKKGEIWEVKNGYLHNKVFDIYTDEYYREFMIKELIGNRIKVDAEWLKENDIELLYWIIGSEYWGKGYNEYNKEKELTSDMAVVELHFNEGGVGYIATHNDGKIDVRQALNNQPYWGEDDWEDWDNLEVIEKYYRKI